MPIRSWTPEEDEYLRSHAHKQKTSLIAEHLDRTEKAVRFRFTVLGLKKPKLYVGQRFDRLEIVSIESRSRPNASKSLWFTCRCDCGKEVGVWGSALRSRGTRSCGCLHSEQASQFFKERMTTHGLSKSPIYAAWCNMRSRCTNPNFTNYADYGGRGISICEAWQDDFPAFYQWAMSAGWAPGLTIERENVNEGYSPENCTIATQKEQANNKRNSRKLSAFGEEKTVAQWIDDPRCSVSYETLYRRIQRGSPPEQAITQKLRYA